MDEAMRTKECFKCKAVLPIRDFYRHPMMGDGHLGKCKACTKRDVALNYRAKRHEKLEYERRRARTPERRASNKASVARRHALHPENRAAMWAVQAAVRKGWLKRPDACERCGAKGKVWGHHPDYSKPLDVKWVCMPCHAKEHGQGVL